MNEQEQYQPPQTSNNGQIKAIIALGLGTITFFIPTPFHIIGLACAIAGLILANNARRDYKGGFYIAGFVVCIVAIVFASFAVLGSGFLDNFFTWWRNWMF
ncbi:MAG: hypothetical protein FWC69_04745 [Defluviitaleaceae bacterium]|nr:hypothetical protein [Defluviitaleaceae bacterium]